MTTFDNREHGFENKFAHDQETEFNIIARRNKLLGHWAAERMSLSQEDAKDYALTLVEKAAQKDSATCVLSQISEDFTNAKITFEKSEIEIEMDRFLNIARDQIING
jgi:hypothetical protein